MRALIQRVKMATVSVADEVVGEIGLGLVVFVGVAQDDTDEDIQRLTDKVVNLRVFPSTAGDSHFDRSVMDVGGGVLLVSQFTLHASLVKGRRPSLIQAAPPTIAEPLFEQTIEAFRGAGVPVATGRFGASMLVRLENDGPATFAYDTKQG